MRELLLYPHNALRQISAEVDPEAPETAELAEEMLGVLNNSAGYGLAANQIGVAQRVIVYDMSAQGKKPRLFANPKVVSAERTQRPFLEGCLSLLSLRERVFRPWQIEVEAYDLRARKVVRFEPKDKLEAICIQHEIDHLDGKMFFDRIGPKATTKLFERYEQLKGRLLQDQK